MTTEATDQLTIRLIKAEDEEQVRNLVYYRIFVQTAYDIIWINYKRAWFLTALGAFSTLIYWTVSDSSHPTLRTLGYTVLFVLTFFLVARWILLPVYMALNAYGDVGTGLHRHWSSHPDRRMWVGVYGRKVVATAAVKRNTETTAEVHRVATHQHYTGRGIGRSMMQQIINYCQEQGFKDIYLETSEAQISAQFLYKKMGFAKFAEYWEFSNLIALFRMYCFEKKLVK